MRKLLFLLLPFLGSGPAMAQEKKTLEIHGDFLIDAQTYQEDTAIGATDIPEQMAMNAYGNFNFTYGNFYGGLRFEAFMPPILGYDPRWEGFGIPYRYFGYNNDGLDITVGSFYEQYGSGMVNRSYWEWYLGYDTFYEGVRVRYKPVRGLMFKAMVGKQRFYWDFGEGLVRGIDAEIDMAEFFPGLRQSGTGLNFGASFVSKFQEDQNPFLVYPENVGNGAFRGTFSKNGFLLNAEYAYKVNDPSAINGNNYRPGQGLLVNAGYSKRGLGFNAGFKRWDNMDYRSERSATGFDLLINYNPAMAKQHTYRLATMYAYATNPNGEMAWQADLYYNFKRGTALGGKYGTLITINWSQTYDIVRDSIQPPDFDTRKFYTSPFMQFGTPKWFEDFNIEINKKISRKTRIFLNYLYQERNNEVQPVTFNGTTETVYTNIGIVEVEYKFTSKKVLRTEFQYLQTEQDFGDWCAILSEYTLAPHWYFSGLWEYNLGNPDTNNRDHYFSVYTGYRRGPTNIRLGYGRQRQGILCVGGVCRPVPASNGLILSIQSSF